MAFSATTAWEVRTTGLDTNGGGFNVGATGTDFSQQDSPQVSYTDLVIGTTTTNLTSAVHPFSSVDVGNIINITGGTGFTVARYQVISVSGTTATVDRAVGTASSTGGTGNLGGGLATLATAVASTATGNTVWVKSGTYTQTTSSTFGNTGYLIINGYGTTHGDNGTPPLLTTATNSINLIQTTSTAAFIFVNMSFSSTATTKGYAIVNNSGTQAGTVSVNNCTFDGFITAVNGDESFPHGNYTLVVIYATEVKNCTSTAVSVVGISGQTILQIVDCNFHSNANGIFTDTSFLSIVGSLIVSNTGYGLESLGALGNAQIYNSVFAGNGGDGVNLSVGGTTVLGIQNNIFYGNGSVGFAATPGNYPISFFNTNAFGANTGGNGITGTNVKTLTANPFTNSAGGDYSLNSTAGGGALLKGAGYPGVFPGGLSTGHLDIGAIQSSSGGSTVTGGSYAYA